MSVFKRDAASVSPRGGSVRILRPLAAAVCLTVLFGMAAVRASAAPAGTNPGRECRSQVFDRITPEDIPSDGAVGNVRTYVRPDALLPMEASAETEGYIPLVMIVVGFEGQPYQAEYDWSASIFRDGKSLCRYYRDMSSGRFTFLPVRENSAYGTGGNANLCDRVDDGIIHVSLDMVKERGWAIEDYDREGDLENMTAFAKALHIASEYMDFRAYDSNGNGKIENGELAVGFVVAGRDAAWRGSVAPSLRKYYSWPNAYSFSECRKAWKRNPDGFPDVPVIDGVEVDGFISIAESYEPDRRYDRSGSNLAQESFGTLAHELGHYLGLPDLYGAGWNGPWQAYDSLYLSLMNMGNYGTDPDGNPVPYSLDAWSRMTLGWADPEELLPGRNNARRIAGVFDESSGLPTVLRIHTEKSGESYLIENRRFTGWDAGMEKYYPDAAGPDGEDPGGGLILWHIDDGIIDAYLARNTVVDCSHRPGVMPLFWEYDGGLKCPIGTEVDTSQPFFGADRWGDALTLPLYTSEELSHDAPSDRTLSSLVLIFETGSAPVMRVRLTDTENPDDPVQALRDAFDAYKDDLSAALSSLGMPEDSDAVRRLFEEAGEAVGSLEYDETISPEENKAAADAVFDRAAETIRNQRETESFEEYKERAKDAADALARPTDGAAAAKLIGDAKAAIDSLSRREEQPPEQNEAAVDAVLEQLAGQLAAQRAWEETLSAGIRASLTEGWRRIRRPGEKREAEEARTQVSEEAAETAHGQNGPWENPFTDVSEADPFYGDVRYVWDNGIMNGISEDLFDPEGTLTRGMLVTILFRLEGEPDASSAGVFADVADGAWYADGVNWAASRGIVNGYGNGCFGPADEVTREQLAAILYRYAAYKGYGTGADTEELRCADASDVSGWAREAVRWACGVGVLDGGGTDAIRPAEPASRGETARSIRVLFEDAAG